VAFADCDPYPSYSEDARKAPPPELYHRQNCPEQLAEAARESLLPTADDVLLFSYNLGSLPPKLSKINIYNYSVGYSYKFINIENFGRNPSLFLKKWGGMDHHLFRDSGGRPGGRPPCAQRGAALLPLPSSGRSRNGDRLCGQELRTDHNECGQPGPWPRKANAQPSCRWRRASAPRPRPASASLGTASLDGARHDTRRAWPAPRTLRQQSSHSF